VATDSEPVADEPDRVTDSSVEVTPRLELMGGYNPMTIQTPPSTLKILTATRVDSPSRRK
jgi:hypothetical protein